MKVIEKCKEIEKKLNSIPVDKYFWLIPLIEVLLLLPYLITYISMDVLLVMGFSDLFPVLCGFGFFILKLSILNNSLILKILSFVPFILNLVFLVLFMNGKKKFIWLIDGLYILDFIFSLVFFITGNYGVSVLQAELLIKLILNLIFLVTVQSLLAYMFVFYKMNINGKLKTQPKEIRKNFYSKMSLIVTVFTAVTVVVFAGVWVSDSEANATKDEVMLLNKCYGYSEKYLYGELPKDKETLEKMMVDIDSVIETDVFKKAFNQSEYKNRLHESEVKKNSSVLIIKSEYANELMFLKCKILLQLNENDEYLNYYKENYKYFGSTWTDRYFQYVNRNKDIFTDEQDEVIKTGYREVLASDATDFEKYDVFMGLLWFYQNEYENLEKEELKEELERNGVLDETNAIYEDSFKNDDYIENDCLAGDAFSWVNLKDKLYMLK